MFRSRTVRTAAAAMAAAATVGLALATPASAATISQGTVDGAHPADLGCRADQTVIYHTVINGAGIQQGYVDLMASTHCHAIWAHVHGVRVVQNQTYVPQGYVHRNSDGKNSPYCFAGEGTQDCYTTMLWDRGVTSYAVGIVDPNGATGTEYRAQTPSY